MSEHVFPKESKERRESNADRAKRFGKEDFPYADIIGKKRPVSKTHPPMSRYDRAAQFSAFAALTGHSDAISRTADIVEEKVAFEVEREEPEDI